MTSTMPPVGVSLATLKAELETIKDSAFESLAADLFSRLIGDIAVLVSKPGTQFGGDAGTAGLRGRHLRLECKRYRETTPLSRRSLAGEVMEAVDNDPLLEAWVLAATKEVSESERNLARDTGEMLGVTIVVIDWTAPAAGTGINNLAALCATWPELVERHAGKTAAEAARALAHHVGPEVDNLRQDLETWSIGFRKVRDASVEQFQRIWRDSSESRAALNQDAAGGQASVHLVERKKPLSELDQWWSSAPSEGRSPAAVLGLEGVGKTWVMLDWLNRKSADLPITLVLPSSAFVTSTDLSDAGVRDLLARNVRLLTKSGQSEPYWRARIDRILNRPKTEGAAFLLVVDGLNQQPHVRWSALAQTLQGESLAGRIRLLCTSRKHYFRDDIVRFGRLTGPAIDIEVGPYSETELQQLCVVHGLDTSKMSQQLKNLVATPRLFPLVVRLKDSEALQSESTVLRLLFEYGRDVLQSRQHSALTGDAWAEWLTGLAKSFHDRVSATGRLTVAESRKQLSESLKAAHIGPEEVARRLNDVVEGGFYEQKKTPAGTTFVLREEPALIGLGLALLETLWGVEGDFQAVHSAALEWLEPIAAIDQASQVVHAALAVLSATDDPPRGLTDVLLVLWMNVQNPKAGFERDALTFGDAFPISMLTVVEHSTLNSQNVAFHYAVQSLRRLPRARVTEWAEVLERMVDWASWTPVPRPEQVADPNHYAKGQQEQLVKRLGSVQPGEKSVFGELLKFGFEHPGDPSVAIPGILEGHELSMFMPVFGRAAAREAVRADFGSKCWEGVRWLVMLACQEPQKARQALELLADDFLSRQPEPGVDFRLRNRIAAYLLRLTGEERLEIRAAGITENYGQGWDYQEHYLKDPAKSYSALEKRHVQDVLTRGELSAWERLDRLGLHMADPATTLPDDVRQYLVQALDATTFDNVDTHGQRTVEEHRIEKLVPLAARFTPLDLARMRRRHLAALTGRDGYAKKWSAQAAPEFLLLVDAQMAGKFGTLRTRSVSPKEETWANTYALRMELLHLDALQQLERLLEAKDYYAAHELFDVLRPATAQQLLDFYVNAVDHREDAALLTLRVMLYQRTEQVDALAQELASHLQSDRSELKDAAFEALALCAPEVAGRALLAANWKVHEAPPYQCHFGSIAVAAASKHLPFTEVLSLVAPWLWLKAAVARGGEATELLEASRSLHALVKAPSGALPNFEGVVSVRVPTRDDELPRLTVAEPNDASQDIRRTLDRASRSPDEVAQRMQDLAKNVVSLLQTARGQGMGLYLQTFSYKTVEAAYLAAPTDWEQILEGADEGSAEFMRRLHAAEGLYLALCEVLLRHAPDTGLRLWRALVGRFRIRFNGRAKIPELVHIIFRVPECPQVLEGRADLTDLSTCNTDQDCLELVVAAQVNGCTAWLEKLIAEDESSNLFWRKKRAIVLRGLYACPPLDALPWKEGELIGSWQALSAHMRRWSIRGSLAKHWWSQFLSASTPEGAYASWEVFSSLADRRRYLELGQMPDVATELDRLRELHVLANWRDLTRKMEKQESDSPSFADHLFGAEKPAKWLMLDGQLSR